MDYQLKEERNKGKINKHSYLDFIPKEEREEVTLSKE